MTEKTEQSPDIATPVKVLVESRVVVEPGWTPVNWSRKTEEEKAKWLNGWAQELMQFFRDHRSQDVNSVCVEPVYEKRCSACNHDWEPVNFEAYKDEPAYVGCAWCGKPIE